MAFPEPGVGQAPDDRPLRVARGWRGRLRRANSLLRPLGVSAWTGDAGDQVMHHARGSHRFLHRIQPHPPATLLQ